MTLRPPRATRTDTSVPYTSPCRSGDLLHPLHVLRELAEDLADRPVLQVVADLPERAQDGVGVPDAVGTGVDRAHALLRPLDRVDDRAREQEIGRAHV